MGITNEIIEKYKFEEYTINGSENSRILISKAISKYDDLDPCFKSMCLTVLTVKESATIVPYNFDNPYSGWYYSVAPFIMFVHGLANLSPEFIYGRIVHLSQSSGYGKTRLCWELLKYMNCGGYCVYRSGTEGYPNTTPWMKDLYDTFQNDSKDANHSMMICIRFIEQLFDRFHNYKDDWNNIKNMFVGTGSKRLSFNLGSKDEEIDSAKVEQALKNLEQKLLGHELKFFPIVFDEVHELLITPKNNPESISLYRALRRVFFALKKTKAIGIFLGTKTSLQDFVLRTKNDPGIRDALDDKENLIEIPCYIFNQTVDIMLNSAFHIDYANTSETKIVSGTQISCPPNLIQVAQKAGRPLWNFFKSFPEAFKAARSKLNCDESITGLTCFILRTGSVVVSQDDLAHRLVLSGMATLLNIDLDGSRCSVVYVPEPILSNNARLMLTNINFYEKTLSEYLRRLQLGSFHDSGYSVELISRIILLRAMDLALLKQMPLTSTNGSPYRKDAFEFSSNQIFGEADPEVTENFLKQMGSRQNISSSMNFPVQPSSPNLIASTTQMDVDTGIDPDVSSINLFLSPNIGVSTLREYLMLLGNLTNDELIYFGVSNEVLDGFANLNQFVQIFNPMTIDQPYLMHFFAKSCGAILATGAIGADLMIPVLRKDNKMSCVMIQVKNYGKNIQSSFPKDSTDVCQGFSKQSLEYLTFKKVGDFPECHEDDFVRIVIQFDCETDTNPTKVWQRLVGSKSLQNYENLSIETSLDPPPIIQTSDRNQTPLSCNVLWLNGIRAFQSHLFFNNPKIIKYLEEILN